MVYILMVPEVVFVAFIAHCAFGMKGPEMEMYRYIAPSALVRPQQFTFQM